MPRNLSVLLVMLLVAASPVSADVAKEDVLKLALVYKIARFVTWPSGTLEDEFNLCIAGNDTYATARERLTGRNVGDRPLNIRKIEAASDLAGCQAIYVTDSEYRRTGPWLLDHAGKPILTLSDATGFATNGGIVGLIRRNNRIGMQINLSASQSAGLEINSQLLQLADLVDSGKGASE